MQKKMISVLALVLGAGQAMGQVTVDGQIDATEQGLYTLNWLQNQPTSFGDNQTQAPTPDDVDDAALASTGLEIKFPLVSLADDMGNIAPTIQFIAFINGQGHDFVSNQVTGGLGNGVGNVGEPRTTSFAASSPTNPNGLDGTQTIDVPGMLVGSASAPTLDGAEDAAYGAALFVQNTGTGFGDSNDPSAVTATGSEIDEAFAVIVDENDDGMVDAGDTLYILLTGNVETNFNKLDMFIDSIDGDGQNRLRGDNPDVDFNGLNRMGDDGGDDGNLDGLDLGLQFEPGFDADVYFGYTNGDTGGQIQAFMNAATLPAAGAGAGAFLGGSDPDVLSIVSGAAAGEIGEGVEVVCDNSNISGVGTTGFVAPAPDPDFANGSELDAMYTYVDQGEAPGDDTLYIFLAGNLETNFNRLHLFLDGDAADGQNVMRNDNLDINFNALNRLGAQEILDIDGMPTGTFTPGLTWDTDFAPDYVLFVGTGNNPPAMFVDASVLRTDGPLEQAGFVLDYGSYDGGDKSVAGNNPVLFDGDRTDGDFENGPVQTPTGPDTPRSNYAPRQSQVLFPTEPLPGLIQVALDNNNVAGVTATDAAMPSVDDAANVMTGIEIAIDLEEAFGAAGVGIDPANIKIGGYIINSGGFFLSNQVIGGLPAADEVGQADEADFSMIAGNQFVRPTDTVMTNPMFLCADANQDGSVTPTDFGAWLGAFNGGLGNADANDDNSVTPTDFGAWLSAFNQGAAGPMCDHDLGL